MKAATDRSNRRANSHAEEDVMRLIGAAATLFVLTLFLIISGFGRAAGAQQLNGRDIFRFDTLGDEQLWTDALRLQEALETVTPAAALGLGLKVDADALAPRSGEGRVGK